MTPLETAREVNNALQKGDFASVFAALKAQPDLRVSELPTLEQKSLKALAGALQAPESARIWADALLSSTASVRLFAYKTLLRLRGAAKPIALPLQNQFLNIWEFIVPVPQSEWHVHREQHEMLARAVEVLFCADTKGTLQFCEEQIQAHMPSARAQAQQVQAYYVRRQANQQALNDAIQAAVAEIVLAEHKIAEKWGVNSLPPETRMEIYERAKSRPEVASLLEKIGEDPTTQASLAFPLGAFIGAIHRLVKSKSQPQKATLEQLREPLWAYIEAGFKPSGDDQAAFARQLLSYGAMPNGEGLFSDNFLLGRGPQLLAAVRENPEAEDALNKMDNSISSVVYPAQLQLWGWLALSVLNAFLHDRLVHPAAWPAENALPLLRVLWFKDNASFHLHRRVQEAAALYGGLDRPPPTVAPQISTPSVEEKQVPSFEIVRREGEDACNFVRRTSENYEARLQNLQALFHEDYSNPRYHSFYQETLVKFREALYALNDEEKREVFLGFSCEEKNFFYSLPPGHYLWGWFHMPTSNPAGKAFLRPIAAQLWVDCEEAIQDVAREQKLNRSRWDETETLKKARIRFQNSKILLLEVDGVTALFRMLQSAQRLRTRVLAKQIESELLSSYFDVAPPTDSVEDWIAWKLDESADAFLEQLAQSMAKWPVAERGLGYARLATGFYRRFTSETRRKCWEMAALSNGNTYVLFRAIDVYRDDDTWLATLQYTPRFDDQFFSLWRLRRDYEKQDTLVAPLIVTLSNASTESAVAMMLKMLEDLSIEELAAFEGEIAQAIESPHEKVAKWALETLLQISPEILDWPRVIQATGEKLWSQNAGLAKIAAKFLSTTPAEHSALAWEKLNEAATLDNKSLVEAILRALVTLKSKNRALALDSASRDHLETLAQLAPERFEKLSKKLET